MTNIILKHMDKLRSIYTLVLLIVVAISFTSCSDDGFKDLASSNSAELTIDGKKYVMEKGVSVGEAGFDNNGTEMIYEFIKSQSELFFQLNSLKGKRIAGAEFEFEDSNNLVNSVIKLDGDTPGFISKSGIVKIVSDKEIKLIGCIYLEEGTDREVSVDGTIKFEVGSMDEFCEAKGDASSAWIESLDVQGVANVSGSDDGYGDFTYLLHKLSIKKNRTFELTPGYSSTGLLVHWKIFIDYNKNGDFSDAGETILMTTVASTNPYVETMKLPDAVEGQYRMRVVMKVVANSGDVNNIDGCTNPEQGEVEDYTVKVVKYNS